MGKKFKPTLGTIIRIINGIDDFITFYDEDKEGFFYPNILVGCDDYVSHRNEPDTTHFFVRTFKAPKPGCPPFIEIREAKESEKEYFCQHLRELMYELYDTTVVTGLLDNGRWATATYQNETPFCKTFFFGDTMDESFTSAYKATAGY